jgi:UDP-N-acetylenolpyruvoylglucosamine reductase
MEGIPGTVGGALRMNAGAMGGTIFEVVERVRLMGSDGVVQERTVGELAIGYRSCETLTKYVALSAVLRGRLGSREAIDQRMNEYSQKRWRSQPAAPSAGCIFKNPASVPAGKLIEELGLKGTRVGGAVVSVEHGNFIVNHGAATARDVLELIELIRQRAQAERGINLETEVQIVGE